jgi:hypothetical protein
MAGLREASSVVESGKLEDAKKEFGRQCCYHFEFYEMPTTWIRLVCKFLLYSLYVQTCEGFQTESVLVKAHIVYIFASTMIDAAEESKPGDWVKWVHHAATWWLLFVYLLDIPFASQITVHLLGAVDLTDLFFYMY